MEYIKKIHNAVFVSDRIVTYKSAAAILNVNVNEAKKYLEEYVHKTESKNETLNVSYVIGGLTLTDQNKVRIVSQNKYNEAKTLFKTLTINHIYSVQKTPLTDWVPVFNVDDFLYDENETPTKPRVVKQEVITKAAQKKAGISNFLNNADKKKTIQNQPPKTIETDKTPTESKEIKTKTVNKKTGISNFLNNDKKKTKQNQPQKTIDTAKPKKQENHTFTNFFNKNNKENVEKSNVNIKEEISDSDDEDIFKVTKKRTRVLNDDEENEIPAKCAKVDILDASEDEAMEEYHSDEDIFGSPEKDEELMKDSETSGIETNTEENSEKSEPMFEDDDGYFVTEKEKSNKSVPSEGSNKKESKEKTESKKSKKEIVQKIKNNSNQKSILNFFQKKM